MGDITNPRWFYVKGGLFVVTGLLASGLRLFECPSFKVAVLLALAIWCFARAYYFAFYVVEHYADPGYRFAGLWSFARYAWAVVADRLYVGLGMSPEQGRRDSSYFRCLDIAKKGDVSLKSYDAKAAENKNSALVWAFGGRIDPPAKKGPRFHFGRTVSTAAVHDGLVYIPEEDGFLHCLDVATVHDTECSIHGSACWVDGRVFLGNDDGEILIFAHGRTANLLTTINMDEMISTTPVALQRRAVFDDKGQTFRHRHSVNLKVVPC